MRSLIERNQRVRSLVKAEPVQRVLHGVRGCQAVDERAAFVRRQLRGRGMASYRLHNGLKVWVRHGTPDMTIFTRVFWRRMYEPPAELRSRLRAPLRVLDLGANIGLFSAGLGPDVTVTAVEADPHNADVLEQMVAVNELPWRVIRGYAAARSGTIPFAAGRYCLSKADASGEPVSKIDVFPLFDGVDLLKMDIEGGEWEILADPRMAEAPPVVVMEWHTFSCPGADARLAACEALRSAGYAHVVAPQEASANGHLWAWR